MAGQGKPKTGGRQKGTPNRIKAEIQRLAIEHGEDMINELAHLAIKADSEAVRVAAIKEMLDRGYGRPLVSQAIDVLYKPDDEPITMIERARALGHILTQIERERRQMDD